MRTGGGCCSIVRICTGDVCVRKSNRSRTGLRSWPATTSVSSIFLLHNFLTFGNITPISGLLKLAISAREGGVRAVNGIVIAYVFVILIAGIICLTSKNAKTYSPVVALFAGQAMFVIYVMLFNNAEVGSWYFVSLSVTAALGVSLIYTAFVDRLFGRVQGRQVVLLGLLLVSGCLSVFLSMRYGARTETWSLPIARYFASDSLSDVARRNDVKRVLAFDRPGELAFFDGLWVIPTDGLTTNLQIQRELDSRGIEWLIEHYGIDALVLPRLDGRYALTVCDKLYLNSILLHCIANPEQAIVRVDFFSRLSGKGIGQINIDRSKHLEFEHARDLDVVLLR